MSRGTLVYILMFGALVGGMWVILPLGEALVAPFNLAGRWEIEPDLTMGPRVGPPLGRTMEIEQSGRYFLVRFASGRTLDLKLRRETRQEPRVKMELAGGGWDMTCDADATDGTMRIDLRGAVKRVWTARRVDPADADAHDPPRERPRAVPASGPAADADADPDDEPSPMGPSLPDPLEPPAPQSAPQSAPHSAPSTAPDAHR